MRKKKAAKRVEQQARSWTAVAAHMRSGAGSHGGTARQKNRRDRRAARRELDNA